MQPPGKIATMCAVRLKGKHKPIYHALSIREHSSKSRLPSSIIKTQKLYIVKLAVYGMLPRNLLRPNMMQRLHLFAEDELPEDILANLTEELPQPRDIPRTLSQYTQEEKDAFPRLWTPY
ncbi:hypothetical protein CRUP_032747, partial [Coryphaenoides rupestris]